MVSKYEIKYLPIAEEDLSDIIDYILTDNPDYAMELLRKFNETISRLENFPNLGVVPKDSFIAQMNYRILIVDAYLVFYVFINDTIEIQRIINGKRKYDYLL
ncbi:type II toxin-antitoxin system RelE/ParE family toxin [Poseidonibacter sp.]|uniref:type II toxin-antitoxin system RelE/ParE family toxin n=1 Tax=Poseidonibacter sp. TaxID=2321188 RepID=UPI003C7100D8